MSRSAGVTSALVLATVCSTGLLGHGPTPAAAAGGPGAGRAPAGVLDVRRGQPGPQQKAAARRSAALQATGPVRALARRLGPQAVIDLDPLTGTPRQVGRLDGSLTRPSTASPEDVALGYVRAHADVFGL